MPATLCTTGEETEAAVAKCGGEAVVKIVAGAVTHKTDAGGVKLGVTTVEARAAFDAIGRGPQRIWLAAWQSYLFNRVLDRRVRDGTYDRLLPGGSAQRGGVSLEEGIPLSVMARLAEMGHPVTPVSGLGRGLFGRGQIICRDRQSGVLCAGSDPRADGCAMPLG